jgi:zinc transport system permease protein
MTDFFAALRDIPFFRYALVAGLLASVSLGIVGSYVVTRRITYIAAAISHCVLGGIGAALYLQKVAGWQWCDPIGGALVAALVSAVIIGLVSLYARQREDTVISAVWAVGMAVGLVFFAKTPGYVDAMSYLFGDILLISARDVWLIMAMDAVVVVLGLGFYPKLLALCFDEEFAALRGVRVKLYYLLLLCLTALTVVLLVRVVGIVLVIALLTLPAAVAGHFVRQLWQMMAVAVVCSMAFVTAGIAVSFPARLPSGPVIILIAGATYLLVALFGGRRRSGARGRG